MNTNHCKQHAILRGFAFTETNISQQKAETKEKKAYACSDERCCHKLVPKESVVRLRREEEQRHKSTETQQQCNNNAAGIKKSVLDSTQQQQVPHQKPRRGVSRYVKQRGKALRGVMQLMPVAEIAPRGKDLPCTLLVILLHLITWQSGNRSHDKDEKVLCLDADCLPSQTQVQG
jgi:hypothetical protein